MADFNPPLKAYLRPFLGKLIEVSGAAKAMADEDDERAMREAAEGTVTSEPRMDRLRDRLEKGAGLGDNREAASSSVDQSVAHLANSVNELAIGKYFIHSAKPAVSPDPSSSRRRDGFAPCLRGTSTRSLLHPRLCHVFLNEDTSLGYFVAI